MTCWENTVDSPPYGLLPGCHKGCPGKGPLTSPDLHPDPTQPQATMSHSSCSTGWPLAYLLPLLGYGSSRGHRDPRMALLGQFLCTQPSSQPS